MPNSFPLLWLSPCFIRVIKRIVDVTRSYSRQGFLRYLLSEYLLSSVHQERASELTEYPQLWTATAHGVLCTPRSANAGRLNLQLSPNVSSETSTRKNARFPIQPDGTCMMMAMPAAGRGWA
jgi:hypothetical protein